MIKSDFFPKLLEWYKIAKRDLPFRNTVNPYFIWLSEIILQQTRVAQGLSYYNRFVELFPTIEDLSKAEEQTVLKAWQGLGYYSRARNLHFTAKYIVNELGGTFPASYKDLIKLKGVGDYTASAIASFSFKEVVPVLDGNVYRFISRLIGIETYINTPKAVKEFKMVLNKLIDKDNPDTFNQAIIEFGALHCTPSNPKCVTCPFSSNCFAFSKNRIQDFPVKKKKKKSIDRHISFYRIFNGNNFYLVKRKENEIWKNLYEFPNIDSEIVFKEEIIQDQFLKGVVITGVSKPIKHVLSHQNIYAKLVDCIVTNSFVAKSNWVEVSELNFETFPIHRLMEKMIEQE